jgi:hypothetical protein
MTQACVILSTRKSSGEHFGSTISISSVYRRSRETLFSDDMGEMVVKTPYLQSSRCSDIAEGKFVFDNIKPLQ